MPTISLKEHLKRARAKVKPENCKRSRAVCVRAAKIRWEKYREKAAAENN